nr:hypothetical protein Iba_chr07bCG4080 [Ipomoea batatas]
MSRHATVCWITPQNSQKCSEFLGQVLGSELKRIFFYEFPQLNRFSPLHLTAISIARLIFPAVPGGSYGYMTASFKCRLQRAIGRQKWLRVRGWFEIETKARR